MSRKEPIIERILILIVDTLLFIGGKLPPTIIRLAPSLAIIAIYLGITCLALYPPVKSLILVNNGEMHVAEVISFEAATAYEGLLTTSYKIKYNGTVKKVDIYNKSLKVGDIVNFYIYYGKYFNLQQITMDKEGFWWTMFHILGGIKLLVGYTLISGFIIILSLAYVTALILRRL